MNIQQMMKQAQQMQERLQKQMAELKVEATAGGGMVTVVMNGSKQLQSITIDPEAVSKDDVEMLQDLILAAINDAHGFAPAEIVLVPAGSLPRTTSGKLQRFQCRSEFAVDGSFLYRWRSNADRTVVAERVAS